MSKTGTIGVIYGIAEKKVLRIVVVDNPDSMQFHVRCGEDVLIVTRESVYKEGTVPSVVLAQRLVDEAVR